MRINILKSIVVCLVMTAGTASALLAQDNSLTYPIVDTNQTIFYNDRFEIKRPTKNQAFYGQDAEFTKNPIKYKNNGDGTVTDLVTGLMWISDPADKKSYYKAVSDAKNCRIGGYTDWRLPTTKELYSLIIFSGSDINVNGNTANSPFIDTEFFKFTYGQAPERIIDSQYATSTIYTGKVMMGQEAMFGVNFADGRIKSYPTIGRNRYYALYVRGNKEYGQNKFVDNKDGTISDKATGLMWMQTDNKEAVNWEKALDYAKNSKFAGHSDWRLPNAKELQSIVDYSRGPQTTNSPAISPLFECSEITDEGGNKNYPFYWSSTTHARQRHGDSAVYICFGEGLGFMSDRRTNVKKLMDVHGAGCQRSDPKAGDASKYAQGRGPQGDVLRIKNYVRLVRDNL